jgi:hypothetical protein
VGYKCQLALTDGIPGVGENVILIAGSAAGYGRVPAVYCAEMCDGSWMRKERISAGLRDEWMGPEREVRRQ